jgi:hypothetical protein
MTYIYIFFLSNQSDPVLPTPLARHRSGKRYAGPFARLARRQVSACAPCDIHASQKFLTFDLNLLPGGTRIARHNGKTAGASLHTDTELLDASGHASEQARPVWMKVDELTRQVSIRLSAPNVSVAVICVEGKLMKMKRARIWRGRAVGTGNA